MKTIAAPAMAAIESGEAIVTGAVSIIPTEQAVIPPEIEEGAEVILTWQQSTFEQGGNDQARMGIGFLDDEDALIGSVTWATLTAPAAIPTWTERTVSANAPAGAYRIRFYMEMQRVTGSQNDGYIDAIEAALDGVPLTLVNPGAESADMTGWTNQTGAVGAAGPGSDAFAGLWWFFGGSVSNSISYQDYPSLTSTGDPIRLWGGYGPITIDGEVYQGIGARGLAQQNAGAIGGIAQGLTLTVSGIEPAALELLDADEIKGAPAVLYRMIFASDGKTLLDAHVFDRGRVDTVDTDETIGGQATINVAVESAARGLGRSGARRRADSDQRLIDPDDGYFKNTSYAGQKTLYWGGKRPRYGSAG